MTECAWECGNSTKPGEDLCPDCKASQHDDAARHERREQREKARLERVRQLKELAEQGCGCASEAECKMDSTDWHAMPKSKSRKLFDEMGAACMRHQRWRKEHEERRAAADRQREAEREEHARAVEARWEAVTVSITPSPLLTSLRRTVLANRHDRCPKWRFQLAPHFVVQIQPRPAERRDQFHLFDCIAIQGEGITKEHFANRTKRAGWTSIEFGIVRNPDTEDWRTHPTAFNAGADSLMRRVAEVLPKLEVIDSRQMFSANCLICGKGLTDPASMARWIGPECAGTASLTVGLIKPKPAAATDLFDA